MAVRADDLTGPEHRVVASVEVGGGFRVECSCEWLSPVCPDGVVLFGVWAHHCLDAELT